MPIGSGRGKCVFVLMVLVLMTAALAASFLAPWWSKMKFYDGVIEQSVDRISRYERLLKSKPQLQKKLEHLGKKIKKSGYFIHKGSSELAAAELQNRIKKIVSSAGGKLISTQNVAEASEEPLQKIEIKVRMKGDVAVLARVLHELEVASPVMTVENLSLRSRRTIKGRRKNRVEGYELDATFVLAGYLLEEKQ